MLPNEDLLKPNGEIMSDIDIGRLIHKTRTNPDEFEEITDMEAQLVTDQARDFGIRFRDRHFIMPVLRERIKSTDDSLEDAVLRLMKEERFRKLKEGKTFGEPFLAYKRPKGKTIILIWMIDIDDTCIDVESQKKRGFSNWFSPKKCPDFCDNDYFETRNHRFVTLKEAAREIENFKCVHALRDQSKWGGDSIFEAILPYIK